MSDIVFLRAWIQVEVPCFYNPVTTALQPRDWSWQGMRTVSELRREHNLPIPVNKDSLYKVYSILIWKICITHTFSPILPQDPPPPSSSFFCITSLTIIYLFFSQKLKGSQGSLIRW